MFYKLVFCFLFILINLNANEKLRVGVLAYGTVNWGLEILKQNGLDKKNGFDLELVKLASKNAQLISLQANEVDIIVNDWIWVNKQKANKKEFMFYPYSKALGTLMINKNSNINSLEELKDKELGIAGGIYDKTWLLFRAYYKKTYGKELQDDVKKVFASPPILYKKMLDNSLNASINFWHFNAKLPKKDFKALINIKDILKELGVKEDISFVGWVFSKEFATKKSELLNSFLKANTQSKEFLNSSDNEWNKIRALMKVKNEEIFNSLKQQYKKGTINKFDEKDIDDLEKIYKILSNEAGASYISSNISFSRDIFYLENK